MVLWPVFLSSSIQGDGVRLFELGDVLTLPVELIDAAAAGWPADVGVVAMVSVVADDHGGNWATTDAGVSVRTGLASAGAETIAVRAGLTVEFMITSLMSYVTGTVRRIELVSVPAGTRGAVERASWTLTETPVAPVSFREPFDPGASDVRDEGMLIHLELFTPHCRCDEISALVDDARAYADRHLRATAEDHAANTVDYLCPDTGVTWLWHRWKRKRCLEGPLWSPWEPMMLTQQPSPEGVADRVPVPVLGVSAIAPGEVAGQLRDVAQLTAEGGSDLERVGVRLTSAGDDRVGPTRTAAAQLSDGTRYLLVQHLGHPDRFIDVRADTDERASRAAARRFLAAVAVPEAHVLWRHEVWPEGEFYLSFGPPES